MNADIDRILIPQDRIAQRVRDLAVQITADLARSGDAQKSITIMPIMTGAMIFCADLMRHMPIAMRMGLLTVSSYPGKATASQGPTISGANLANIKGQHVLLLDDILDSGNTIRHVVPILRAAQPANVKVCVLLRKDRASARVTQADYVGFDIPDEFVVGYGLDYDNYYRNLPDIVTLKREVYARDT
jgi:hypoxanthine phosphoribosyltransferase